jgi:hypothetical protein
MPNQAGVIPVTVQRIWLARGLKPHLVKIFKISVTVVNLYLNPPLRDGFSAGGCHCRRLYRTLT